MFLVSVFTPKNRDFKLDSRTISPTVHVGWDTRLDFFSDIYEVEIHPDRYQRIFPDVDKSNPHVALKELRMDFQDSDLIETFEKETRVLRELRMVHHIT